MIIRIEALGHVLTLTLNGTETDTEEDEHPNPVANDPPLEVYADTPSEPLGYHKIRATS